MKKRVCVKVCEIKTELNTTVVEYVRGFDNKKRIIEDKLCVCALLARDNFCLQRLNYLCW